MNITEITGWITGGIYNVSTTPFHVIFWAVVPIVGVAIISHIIKHIKDYRRQRKIKYQLARSDSERSQTSDILPIDHSESYYTLSDIEINDSGKKLFIDCPEDIKMKITEKNKDIKFHGNVSFNKSKDYADIAKSTKINDLPQLINKHKVIVGKEFLEKLENTYSIFNNTKFGVFNFNCLRSSDKEERAKIKLGVFETDYFTHRVFRSIYKELLRRKHPISNVDKESIRKYNAFTTSFGINAYFILESEQGDGIVFARRSKSIAYPSDGGGKWHVTLNEGLSLTDYELERVSILQCLYRGMREELGIQEKDRDEILHTKFFDLFLDKNVFEIGITSYIKLNMTYKKLLTRHGVAKDSELEIDELKLIPFNKNDIDNFVTQNKEQFTSAGLYTLNMVCARELS